MALFWILRWFIIGQHSTKNNFHQQAAKYQCKMMIYLAQTFSPFELCWQRKKVKVLKDIKRISFERTALRLVPVLVMCCAIKNDSNDQNIVKAIFGRSTEPFHCSLWAGNESLYAWFFCLETALTNNHI